MITSCYRGYYEIVEYFISKNIDLDEGYSYHTPLTAACNSGHEKLVQLLINNGGDVNRVDGMRDTPLTTACYNEHDKIVQLLIYKIKEVMLMRITEWVIYL